MVVFILDLHSMYTYIHAAFLVIITEGKYISKCYHVFINNNVYNSTYTRFIFEE